MFDLKNVTVHLANFNPRSELNGEARKPAADLNMRGTFPSSILDDICPGLREMLYEIPKQPDLAEQAEPGAATALHAPYLVYPLHLVLEMLNRKLEIDYGLGPGVSNLILPECKVHKFKVEPQNGGSVLLSWQVSAHPDAAQAGWLYDHQQTDIVISLDEVKQADTQGNLLPAEPKKSKKQQQAEAKAEAEAAFEQAETAE